MPVANSASASFAVNPVSRVRKPAYRRRNNTRTTPRRSTARPYATEGVYPRGGAVHPDILLQRARTELQDRLRAAQGRQLAAWVRSDGHQRFRALPPLKRS